MFTSSVAIFWLLPFTYGSLLVTQYDAKTFSGHRVIKRWVPTTTAEADPPEVYKLHITSSITSRFAMTHVTSKLANQHSASRQVFFTITLPHAAFISNFSMEIGDQIIVGQVKEMRDAREEYDRARARGESAGHVARARETNVFRISTNVGALEKVTFNLTYQELLTRTLGSYKHAINVKTDQVVKDMKILIVIREQSSISQLHVPEFGKLISDKSNPDIMKLPPATNISTTKQISSGYSQAFILYQPTVQDQKQGMDGQIVVLYDVDRTNLQNQIQVINGYFVQFFAPEKLQAGKKHVVFVLDISGSMMGNKLEQTKDAMAVILGDLGPGDVFNIVTFSDNVVQWKPESIVKSDHSVKEAIEFTRSLSADGGTDINEGLKRAMSLVYASSHSKSTLGSMILFLTDGEPTSGETEPDRIISNVEFYNPDHLAIIHSIAFGYNADYSLLKKISLANAGIARKVYEDSDAALQLENFYAQCSKLLLVDVNITYLDGWVKPDSLVQNADYNYYEGSEIIFSGKLSNGSHGNMELHAVVHGNGADGSKSYNFDSSASQTLTSREDSDPNPPYPLPEIVGFPSPFPQRPGIAPSDTIGGYVERTWAYLTIKKLLNLINHKKMIGDDAEIMKHRVIQMSIKYNFVTELTSMVVVQNETVKRVMGEDTVPAWGGSDT